MRSFLCAAFCLSAPICWALDQAVIGTWTTGSGADVSAMEIKANGSATIDGVAASVQAEGGKMRLTFPPAIVLDATYSLQNGQLVVTMAGETNHWRRTGAAATNTSAAPAANSAPRANASAPLPNPSGSTMPSTPTAMANAGGAVASAAGNWLRRPDEGFDVMLPGDFRVLGERDGGILLGSNVTPGLIVIYPNPGATSADLARAQTQGIQEPTVRLTPKGGIHDAVSEGGFGKIIDVAGTLEQTAVQGLLGAFLRKEGTGGLAIIAATTPDSWPKLRPFAEQAARGVRFYPAQVSDRLLQARKALAGHSLVASFNNSTTSQNSNGYYTGTATNSFRAWHCCNTGRCRYEGARSSSFQGGGVIGSAESGSGPRDGHWELQSKGNDFLLIFRFDGGGSASWTVSVDANENVYVDGTRVKVVVDNICNQL